MIVERVTKAVTSLELSASHAAPPHQHVLTFTIQGSNTFIELTKCLRLHVQQLEASLCAGQLRFRGLEQSFEGYLLCARVEKQNFES